MLSLLHGVLKYAGSHGFDKKLHLINRDKYKYEKRSAINSDNFKKIKLATHRKFADQANVLPHNEN